MWRSMRRVGNILKSVKPKFSRHEYKAVWNSISNSEDEAKHAVSGYADEATYVTTAHNTVELLRTTVGVRPDDVILEIGAGVGRVGAVLAPLCREWIGVDVSENMVSHIKRRLGSHPNVRAIATSGFDLSPIPSDSIDMAYCTVVFMHLEDWDRFAYVAEAFRVLKPGGRFLADNVNLLTDDGWEFFKSHCAIPPNKRSPRLSRTSTPQEITTYFSRAGFVNVVQQEVGVFLTTYGTKPPSEPAQS